MADSRRELRDRRLLGEYKELMDLSSRSPLVKIEAVSRHFPPTEYMVTYNCLGYLDSSRTKTGTGHKVRITLTESYPQVPPIFQYETPIFAPYFMTQYAASEHGGKNISNYICIGHIGTPRLPLRNFVIGVGKMIQFRFDSRSGNKPLDTRSLEGADVPEPDFTNEDANLLDIRVYDSPAAKPSEESELMIRVMDESSDDDVGGLIKIL